jgi:quercetin dioxygenase-like cupin family protein
MMKRLFVKKGCKGGLQYHRFKDEAGILVSGKMLIRFDDGNGGIQEKIVDPGAVFHFPPGVAHQEEALEDCVIIEGSTPIFNDRVRMENEYGLGEPEGMPTTTTEEVEFG